MSFAQIPHELAEALSDRAVKLLIALTRILWAKADPTDDDLAAKVGRSRGQVQRLLRELEGQGAITRHRRHGRRTIRLAYTLAGAKSRPAPIARPTRNACVPVPPEPLQPLRAGRAIPPPPPPIRENNNGRENVNGVLPPGRGEGPPTPTASGIVPSDDRSQIAAEPTTASPSREAQLVEGLHLANAAELIRRLRGDGLDLVVEPNGSDPTVRIVEPGGKAASLSRIPSEFLQRLKDLKRAIVAILQPPPPDAEALIKQLAHDQTEAFARATAGRIAAQLADDHSDPFYLKLCQEMQAGTVEVGPVAKAFRDVAHAEPAAKRGRFFGGKIKKLRNGIHA